MTTPPDPSTPDQFQVVQALTLDTCVVRMTPEGPDHSVEEYLTGLNQLVQQVNVSRQALGKRVLVPREISITLGVYEPSDAERSLVTKYGHPACFGARLFSSPDEVRAYYRRDALAAVFHPHPTPPDLARATDDELSATAEAMIRTRTRCNF